MARLPVPGGDDGTWGDVLNQFLVTQHNADGTHNLALDNLTDVNTAGASSGQVLTYNGSSWAPAAGGGGGDPVVGGDLSGTASNAQIVAGAVTDIEVAAGANIAQSKISGLGASLAAKTDTSRQVNTTNSLTGGGDLTANRTLSLVNDAATPGNSRYYGTDGTGIKGFHTIPTQDPTMGGDLSGTASNAQIVAGVIVDADINASAAIAQGKIANLTSDLAAKADKTTTISAGTGLSGGGDLSANRTLAVSNDTTTQRLRVSKAGTLTGTRQELNFIEGSNVTITTADNAGSNRVDVTIASTDTGEANTASNVGAGGVGVFMQKTGANLEFKNINAGSNKVTVTNDGANNEVDIDVVNSSTTQLGAIQLAGDLSGTATVPTVPGLANKINTSEKGQPNGVAQLDGSGKVTPGQLQTSNITKVLPYSYLGTLAVGAGTFRLYNDTGATWTIAGVRTSAGVAPVGASVIVDINKNGTTIFTTQANRPTIAAAGNTSGNVTNMDVTTVAVGEYLTVDIDQIGSTTAGSDLTVQLEVY